MRLCLQIGRFHFLYTINFFLTYEIQQCFDRLLCKAPDEFLSLMNGANHAIDRIDYSIAMQLQETLKRYAIRAEVSRM